jgi:Ser/Thr protein kinase RdoA (MazF antagonist)
MMKLSVMRDFLESAVFNQDNNIVDSILNKWGYDKGTVNFVRASNNFIFIFNKEGKRYILRLSDTTKTSRHEIESELELLIYLYQKNLCVNIPFKSLSGNDVEILNTPFANFYAVVFNFFEGRILDIDELGESQFKLWGESLGNLHKVSSNYKTVKRDSCFDYLDMIRDGISKEDNFAYKEFETILNWFNTLNITESNYGLIHFDFELDNLIWDGNTPQIIDFESSIYSWYIADIAFALRDLFNNGFCPSDKYFKSFIDGYRKEMDISEQDLNEISMFLRYHNLLTYIKLRKTLDIGEEILSNNLQWLINLYNKLKFKINEYRMSFVNLHK